MSTSTSSSTAAEALRMAERGFRIFPIIPNSKVPFVKEKSKDFPKLSEYEKVWSRRCKRLCGGIHLATNDTEAIERWFTDCPDMNYGVSANGLCILDVDVKNGKPGAAELDALGPLPLTLKVKTPSGGVHLYFASGSVGQRKLRSAIDIRSYGGYVVGPGSVLDGEHYSIIRDHPVAALPQRIIAELAKAPERDVDASKAVTALDTDAAVEAAKAFLAKEPGADVGERNMTAFRVACQLKDIGLSPPMIKEVMCEHWNPKNAEPLAEEELETVAHNAHKSGRHAPGSSNPEAEFGDIIAALKADPDLLVKLFPPKPKRLRFPRDISLSQLAVHSASAIVKGLCFPRQQGVIFGGSTEGKSFVAIDLGYHVAHGRAWNGMKVKRRPVLYACLEGQEGFQYRLAAASKHHGDPGSFFAELAFPVVLTRQQTGQKGRDEIIAAAKDLEAECGEPVGLVIIDTLACAISGDDENAVADIMAYFTERAGEISRQTGACTITLHHVNKEGTIRGSSAIKPTVDFMLEVKDGQVLADKVKDGLKRPLFSFTLEDIDLGRDVDGDEMKSAVLKTAPPQPKAAKLTKIEKMFVRAFEEFQDKGLASFDPERSAYIVGKADVWKAFKSYYMAPSAHGKAPKEDSCRAAWRRVLKEPPQGFGSGKDAAGVPYVSRVGDPDLESLH